MSWSWRASLLRLASSCRLLDGGANPDIGAAATDVPGHRGIDIGVVGVRRGCQQRRRRHDLAGLTIAALNHLKVEPGFLYLGAGRRGAHTFDRGDRAIADRAHRQHAGAYRFAVDMHGAGTALCDATAEL